MTRTLRSAPSVAPTTSSPDPARTDGSLALAAPAHPPAEPRPPRLVVVPDPGDRTAPGVPPPPVKVLLRGVLEVLSGQRAANQLVLRTSPEIAQELLGRPSRRSSRPAQVERVRVLRVADRGVEVCAVIRRPDASGRCGALAMRLEFSEGRGWLITRLQVG